MTRTLLLVSLTLTLSVACGKGDKAENKSPPSPMVGKLAALADKGCACKDHACTKRVYAEVAAFAKSIKVVADADKAPMQKAQARLDDCTIVHNPFMKDYKKLTAGVCACKSKRCVTKAAAGFRTWSKKVKATKGAFQRGHLQAFMGYGKTAASCFNKFGVAIPK